MYSDTKKVSAIIQRKWDLLVETDNKQFYRYFRRLWEFIRINQISNEILECLLFNRDMPLQIQLDGMSASTEDSKAIREGRWTYYDKNVGGEERDIAAFIRLMDELSGPRAVKDFNDPSNKTWVDVMYDLAIKYIDPENKDKYRCISLFLSMFLFPILEYIQDKLDTRVFILDALTKFKQKSEWFDKQDMLAIYNDGKTNGEKNLKKFLYEYLFNQGVPFFIEPASPSGEIDFLIEQSGEERIGCEAKVYRGDNKTKLIHGVKVQLMAYLREHNLSVGYMVIFKVSKKELHINLDLERKVNYLDLDGKRIYIFVVDIYKHLKSASVRGGHKLKPHIISKADFYIS